MIGFQRKLYFLPDCYSHEVCIPNRWAVSKQNKYKEAGAIYQRTLTAQEKVLGHEHPSTLLTITRFASLLSEEGKYKEAESMQRRALLAQEKVNGPKHPETLRCMESLGRILIRHQTEIELKSGWRFCMISDHFIRFAAKCFVWNGLSG